MSCSINISKNFKTALGNEMTDTTLPHRGRWLVGIGRGGGVAGGAVVIHGDGRGGRGGCEL